MSRHGPSPNVLTKGPPPDRRRNTNSSKDTGITTITSTDKKTRRIIRALPLVAVPYSKVLFLR